MRKNKQICKFGGEIEINESCFWPQKARGFENKTPVLCMLKRYGKVYTQVVKTIIELITITFLIV
ncbi:MAG: hypothetical protein ACTTIM_05900 [Campylobacter sp.]